MSSGEIFGWTVRNVRPEGIFVLTAGFGGTVRTVRTARTARPVRIFLNSHVFLHMSDHHHTDL
jgi:hypothetical protein